MFSRKRKNHARTAIRLSAKRKYSSRVGIDTREKEEEEEEEERETEEGGFVVVVIVVSSSFVVSLCCSTTFIMFGSNWGCKFDIADRLLVTFLEYSYQRACNAM